MPGEPLGEVEGEVGRTRAQRRNHGREVEAARQPFDLVAEPDERAGDGPDLLEDVGLVGVGARSGIGVEEGDVQSEAPPWLSR